MIGMYLHSVVISSCLPVFMLIVCTNVTTPRFVETLLGNKHDSDSDSGHIQRYHRDFSVIIKTALSTSAVVVI